ncbi:hypothetical protein [Dyadobacter sp. 32]|uniref:hypothetical protein n=1 Tax=Dyadobacter sp. 32 TaxID=538966 RepID=UPI0011EBBD37
MYKSKREIYEDYQIAIKLGIDSKVGGFGSGSYQELYNKLSTEHHAVIRELEWSVENFNTKYPHSLGVFVEIPEKGKDGDTIGVRYLFLQHETGLEVFVDIGEFIKEHDVISTLLGKEVIKYATKKSLKNLFIFLAKKWGTVMRHGIYFVEIRTRYKGVKRLKFEDFKVLQLECLINRFDGISHLSEVNQSCFGGKLMDPPSEKPLSDD